ncbi:MAG: SAM-dependent methyltransferase [Anaerolineaceae bacterium]|nr:SAM-dependent methyltransferase [Anaerolineaceae bacterium]
MTDSYQFASFRDPSGFLFYKDGVLYRQVNQSYREHYDRLMESGLYDALVKQGLMVPHLETDAVEAVNPDLAYRVIQPEIVDFISYPYEWCFHELRSAALTTLRLARTALDHGMILKDASAYNLQFVGGRWQLIDTLSFEIYEEGEPWVAYKQFCQHFLAPLALMAYGDPRLNLMSRLFIDGIPLDIAAKLLPGKTKLRFGLMTHIHLHARTQKRYAGKEVRREEVKGKVSHQSLVGLLDSLRNTVKGLTVRTSGTEWADYYQDTNYSEAAFEQKKAIVKRYIEKVQPAGVWDLGANTGEFSRLASDAGIFTVAFDVDPGAVSKNYIQARKNREENLLPLVMDLTNPSPGLGWAHRERESLMARGPVPMVMALALVHHLAISNNVPLGKLAQFLNDICEYLVIEFVPKSDSQVQRLLRSREDIFDRYTVSGFEADFRNYFEIMEQTQVPGSERILYLMKAKRR